MGFADSIYSVAPIIVSTIGIGYISPRNKYQLSAIVQNVYQ